MDAFLWLYPKSSRRYVILAGYALFFVYCLVIVYHSFLFTRKIYLSEQISLGLEMPMFLVMASLPVCHSLMAIRVLQCMHGIVFKGESAEGAVDAEVMAAESAGKGDPR